LGITIGLPSLLYTYRTRSRDPDLLVVFVLLGLAQDPLPGLGLGPVLARVVTDAVLDKDELLEQEFGLFRCQLLVECSVDQSPAEDERADEYSLELKATGKTDSPGRLDIPKLCNLVDIVVPNVESLGISVNETLKDGLASLLVSMTEFENGKLFNRLRVCEAAKSSATAWRKGGHGQNSRSDVGRLFKLRGRSARAASASSLATNSNSAKLVQGSES
jgi:hypothetical protein